MLNFLSKYKIKCNYIWDHFIITLDTKINLNGEQNTKNDLKKKTFPSEKISITIPNPDQPFYAMGYASNFGIGAALLQSHNGKKMNLISAKSRLVTQA